MELTLKPGDHICIADLIVESHGIMLNDGRKHVRRVKEDDIIADSYLEVSTPHLMVPLDKLGQFWLNTEPRKHRMNVWYLVYPAWMKEEEFQALIKQEVSRVVQMHVKMYEQLLANTKVIHERLENNQWDPQLGVSQTIILRDTPNS